MENQTKTTATVEESQKRQIEEAKKHPLWSSFEQMYKNRYGVSAETSTVLIVMIDRWIVFLAGAKASREYEVRAEIETRKAK